jgi:alpha-tubulin suppressor-like RCC1 family protein
VTAYAGIRAWRRRVRLPREAAGAHTRDMRAPANLVVMLALAGTLGACGARSSLTSGEPVATRDPGTGRTLSASWSHTCAIVGGGKVACWGQVGATPPAPSPVLVDGLDHVVEVAAGEGTDCARRTDGSVWCWGDETDGQLTPITGETFSSIVAGSGIFCGITGGAVACAGDAFPVGPSCGTDWPDWSPVPAAVPALSGIAGVAVGMRQACAFDASGSTSCWGCAGGPPPEGQWDLGSMVASTLTPVMVPQASATIRIASETESTCAVQSSGETICWGDQSQFGPSITVHPVGPEVSDFPPSPIDLDMGVTFSCAAYPDQVRCQGGIPTFPDGCMNRLDTPVTFSLPGVAEVSVGYQHVCARDGSGGVWCWGCNQSGEIGDGTTTPRATPVQVALP